ncbi:MAG: hypothetical protein R3282_05910, partial [Rhodothermales bacterium]|nr:hypothetical protein [Rhodothermales bacterium]
MDEFVIVVFPDSRDVVIDGNEEAGKTNTLIVVNTGRHTFSLQGEQNFTPREQTVLVKNTRANDPLTVEFHKLPAVADDGGTENQPRG